VIEVAGGTYEELCHYPAWHQFFGSGGRAAAVLATLGVPARLHTFADAASTSRRKALADAFGFEALCTTGAPEVLFEYFHALTPVQYVPSFEPLEDPTRHIHVKGDQVIRFGMLEGDAVVEARQCVYDPQTPVSPAPFAANGSRAEELAVVCNLGEAEQLTAQFGPEACAVHLGKVAKVAVVKAGAAGAWVVSDGHLNVIPSYRTASVFPIGSGDVFTAAFAQAWMAQGRPAPEAADFASRATALYCSSMSFPTQDIMATEAAALVPVTLRRPLAPRPRVYLAGPFFTMAQRWLIEEARRELGHVGLDVFSPFHEVGIGRSKEEIVELDLKGLNEADVMVAMLEDLDPGTLFEIGYATRSGKPVVCFARSGHDGDLTMLGGSGAEVTADFATAVYMTAWAAYGTACT
jgi:hypothetical protein